MHDLVLGTLNELGRVVASGHLSERRCSPGDTATDVHY